MGGFFQEAFIIQNIFRGKSGTSLKYKLHYELRTPFIFKTIIG